MTARTKLLTVRACGGFLAVTATAILAVPGQAHSGGRGETKPDSVGRAFIADTEGEAAGLRMVAHLPIPQGADEMTSDIWKLGSTVMTGYRCGGDGSAIIDVAEPTQPRIVARTVAMAGTFANDVKALRLDGPAWSGDLFIEPHDNCGSSTLPAKTRFWDIGQPGQPKLLAQLDTGNGVHNVYPFLRDGKAYLLMALPRGDTATTGAVKSGFAIADITDPRRPRVVGEYSLRDDLGDVPGTDFLHDAWASPDGRLVYCSWWDAGLIVLDIADVTRPKRAQRLTYYERPEWYGPAAGNTHTTVPIGDGRHVVITDEDFALGAFEFAVTAPAGEQRSYDASQDEFLRPLLGASGRGGVVEGALAYAADVCGGPIAQLRDHIALLERAPRCSAADQVAEATEAGALAVVFINPDNSGEGSLEGWQPELRIPAVQLARSAGGKLRALVQGGAVVRVRLSAQADAWGFTRIADLAAPDGPRLVANLTTPNTDRFPARDQGWYTVHNPMVLGTQLYLSHYADGVRQWDITDPTQPFETAYFVPPDLPDRGGRPLKSLIWGVFPEPDYIYASDVSHGLWILAADDLISVPTPPPAPSEDPTVAPSATPSETDTPAPSATATEEPPPTWLPPPVLPSATFTPSATATATEEPTSTPAPSATATRSPTAARPNGARIYLPWGAKPRRR